MVKKRGRPACRVYTVEWNDITPRKTKIRAETAAQAAKKVKSALKGHGKTKRIGVKCSR